MDPFLALVEVRALEQFEQVGVLVCDLLAVGGQLFLAGVELAGQGQVLLHLLWLADFLGCADHPCFLADIG